jgi:sugar phosphate isomerase/epimerase
MLNSVPSKYLSGLWDPGNAFTAGENPYPEGYGKLDRNRIRHIHLKDAVRDRATKRRTWVPIGSGEIDIKGQLRALMRDKYLEGISVETHYVPKNGTPAQGSLESVTGLRKILSSL